MYKHRLLGKTSDSWLPVTVFISDSNKYKWKDNENTNKSRNNMENGIILLFVFEH